jgi:hypothetical protein
MADSERPNPKQNFGRRSDARKRHDGEKVREMARYRVLALSAVLQPWYRGFIMRLLEMRLQLWSSGDSMRQEFAAKSYEESRMLEASVNDTKEQGESIMRKHQDVLDAEQRVADLQAKYDSANPEEKPGVLLDKIRAEKVLDHVQWLHTEVRTGKVVEPSDAMHSGGTSRAEVLRPRAY